jgi:cell division protein FtsW
MVGSASSVISISYYGSPWSIFFKEVMWVVLGLIIFAATSIIDYHRWRRYASMSMMVSLILLVVVLVPGLGQSSYGASRWIGFGQFGIQPSELMKLALALFGADLIAKRQEKGSSYRQIMGPLTIVAALAAGLIIAQPDLGTAMVLMVITLALLFAGGVPMKPVLKGLAAVTVLVTLAAVAMPYRRERLLSFINPGAKSTGSGYQVVQSLIGFGSGHLLGLGLGNSREKWGFLPNAHTDFIFSVIGEELGLVGAVVVVILFGLLAMKGLKTAEQASDSFGSLLAVGLVAWIVTEAIINMGAAIDILPVTGIPLPFISFGGSSMMISMAAAGMLVNIARQAKGTRGVISLEAKRAEREGKKSTTSSRSTGSRTTPSTKRATTTATRSTARATAKRSAARRPAPSARSGRQVPSTSRRPSPSSAR